MSWEFQFKKNIHMYSHELKCKNGNTEFICASEDSAQENNVVLFWLDGLPLNEVQVNNFSNNLESWAKTQGFNFKIFLGKQCISSYLS